MGFDPQEKSSLRLLIVDDQEAVLEIMEAICAKLGLKNVDKARDGAEALALALEREYSIIVCDLNMSGIDGFDLLRAVRREMHIAKTKFIIMSSRADAETILSAKRLGADNYIVKPFSPRAFQEKISSFIS